MAEPIKMFTFSNEGMEGVQLHCFVQEQRYVVEMRPNHHHVRVESFRTLDDAWAALSDPKLLKQMQDKAVWLDRLLRGDLQGVPDVMKTIHSFNIRPTKQFVPRVVPRRMPGQQVTLPAAAAAADATGVMNSTGKSAGGSVLSLTGLTQEELKEAIIKDEPLVRERLDGPNDSDDDAEQDFGDDVSEQSSEEEEDAEECYSSGQEQDEDSSETAS